MWESLLYMGLAAEGYIHKMVNHSVEFVAESGAHTQQIEAQLRPAKDWVRGRSRFHNEHFAQHLCEYLWRHSCKANKTNTFSNKLAPVARWGERPVRLDVGITKYEMNDENTARKFFAFPELLASITGINLTVLKRFAVLLQAISSGLAINPYKFEIYVKETAEMYISLYNWYYMPVTVHKLLIHGPDIIKHAIVPIGQLAEDAQEANHKLFRSYRELHSRKMSRIDNNRDILNNLLINSDSIILHLRPAITTQQREMLLEAKQLVEEEVDLDTLKIIDKYNITY